MGPTGSKSWRQDRGSRALGQQVMAARHRAMCPWQQVMAARHRAWCPGRQVVAARHRATCPRQQVMAARHRVMCPRRQVIGLCALGSKSQDNGSGRPQVMVARSHTWGSKFRKATSQVHEPSRQQVRVAGHRFSCPGWH